MAGAGAVLLIAVIAIVWWLVDVRVHPIRLCPSCRGNKRNTTNRERWGKCRRCGGKGELRRWGARKEKR